MIDSARVRHTFLSVLEQNSGSGADLANEFVVIILDIDMLVDELAVYVGILSDIVKATAKNDVVIKSVFVMRRKHIYLLDRREVFILVQLEVSSHATCNL